MATPTKARFSEHEPYSNLEVAPETAPEIYHDPAANAPERDSTTETPELDKKQWPLGGLTVRIGELQQSDEPPLIHSAARIARHKRSRREEKAELRSARDRHTRWELPQVARRYIG